MARLILDPGRPTERTFELREGASTIGRAVDNEVYVLHKSLSRQHARITVGPEGASLEDLGSKNGTFVEGERVERRELRGPCSLRCGDLRFAYVPEGASLPSSEAPAPTSLYDVRLDPTRRSLGELLVRAELGRTALNLRTTSLPDRSREKLEILLRVSEQLSSPAPIDQVLGRILELVFEILDVDRGCVIMASDQGLEPRVTKTRPGISAPPGFSRQIVSHVLEHGMAALFADTRADPRLAKGESIIAQSICASMCVPLRPRDKLLGALYVDNLSRADRFGQEDLEFLSAFGNQAAIAMDYAILSGKLAAEAVSRSTLQRFFPPAVSEAILQGGVGLGAVDTEATVLFSDLSGYTALSSTMTPREVIGLLHRYFPVMAEVVFRHGGTLEKYIGDALLAVWGAPLAHPDDATRAVRAAIDMQQEMGKLREAGRVPPELAIHVGVNSGPVAAGNIGSEQYLQYATIGDATNVASRICSAASAGEILIDERTARRLDGAIALEPVAPVPVKGKTEPLRLLRVGWQQRPSS